MAAAKLVTTPLGFTGFTGQPGKAGGVFFNDAAGNVWGLSVRNNGTLVILDGDALNNPALDVQTMGTIVGGQTLLAADASARGPEQKK
jgi:formylmethanofuran dehydrogenase subunit C